MESSVLSKENEKLSSQLQAAEEQITRLKEDNQKLKRQMSDISNHVQNIVEGSTYSRGKRVSISTTQEYSDRHK